MLKQFLILQASLLFLVCCVCSSVEGKNIRKDKGIQKFKNPLLFVPGVGGTQIWAKADKKKTVNWTCFRKLKRKTLLWVNALSIARLSVDCVVDNMKLTYNPKTHTTRNNKGVKTYIKDFGSTSSFEVLDPAPVIRNMGTYYKDLVDHAIEKWGYKKGHDLVGAPYDFRRAPNEQQKLFKDLKNLIEKTYLKNDKKKVIVLAHSMGTIMMLYFLQHQTQAWKDKYIESYVSLGGPYAGAAKTALMLASGAPLVDEPTGLVDLVVPRKQMMIVGQSMPSTYLMLPRAPYWRGNEPFLTTPKRDYTINDYKEFFEDMKILNGYNIYNDTENILQNNAPPNVEVFCVYSNGLETPKQFIYDKGSIKDQKPIIITADGDGTVDKKSLVEPCNEWQRAQKESVIMKQFWKKDHLNIIKDQEFFKYLEEIIVSKAEKKKAEYIKKIAGATVDKLLKDAENLGT